MIILSKEERRNADGQENRQADKSGTSTYTTCLRNWNSLRRHKDDYREYPIRNGEGNLPYLKNIIVCLQNQYDKEYFETGSGNCLVYHCSGWSVFDTFLRHTRRGLAGRKEGIMRRMKRKTVWAYLDGKKLVDVVQAALDNNMMVDDLKKQLIKENPGHEVTFKCQ